MYVIKSDDTDICKLRPTAIDTLAALARTIGKDNFAPLAVDTMNLGLTLMEDKDDPDLKRSCYNLFASMASIIKEDMGAALQKIVPFMIESIKSTESITSNGKQSDLDGIAEENDENLDQVSFFLLFTNETINNKINIKGIRH